MVRVYLHFHELKESIIEEFDSFEAAYFNVPMLMMEHNGDPKSWIHTVSIEIE